MTIETKVPNGFRSASSTLVGNNVGQCNANNCYLEVDEGGGAADGDTSHISFTASSSSTYPFYGRSSPYFSISSTAIAKVFVKVSAKYTTTQPSIRDCGIVCGTTVYYVTAGTLTSSYASYQVDWLTNPATGAAWEENEVNATDATTTHRLANTGASVIEYYFRVRNASGGATTQLSAIEIGVDYTSSAAGPTGVKTWLGLSQASVKTVNGLAIASVKSGMGLA